MVSLLLYMGVNFWLKRILIVKILFEGKNTAKKVAPCFVALYITIGTCTLVTGLLTSIIKAQFISLHLHKHVQYNSIDLGGCKSRC